MLREAPPSQPNRLDKSSTRVTHTTPVLVLFMVFEPMLISGAIAFVIVIVTIIAHTHAIITIATHTTIHFLTAITVFLVFVIHNNKMSTHSRNL